MRGRAVEGVETLWRRHLRQHAVHLDQFIGRQLEWGPLADRSWRWRRALQERWNTPVPLLGPPTLFSRDLMWTVMMSLEDQKPQPNDRLLELVLALARRAHRIDLAWLAGRASAEERGFVNQWPGEHYRFMAACVEHLQPRLVVEIGTFTGLSALAMKSCLRDGLLISYDIAEWQTFSGTALTAGDLDGRLEQRIGDLSSPDFFKSQADVLAEADLILLDGPKDGRFETRFLDQYLPIFGARDTVLVIDDTRFVNMIQLWRDLPFPKLDVTSFGHWTGTGLVVAS